MKMTAILMMVVGTAAAAEPQQLAAPAAPGSKTPAVPLAIQQVSTGVVVAPGDSAQPRGTLIPYDTVNSRLAPGFNNWAKVNGAEYTSGAGGGYFHYGYTTPGPVTFPPPTASFVDDNGTPTNPNDDIVITSPTTIIFDDYEFDQSILAGDAYDRFLMTTLEISFVMQNLAVDDNGTPTNPNDDFPVARQNTIATLFWGLNDNGTPTNPNDDFIEFTDGVNFTFNFGANTFFIYQMNPADLTGLPGGGLTVPGQGLVAQDWLPTSTHPTGDNGAGFAMTGGDDRSDGTATGLDGVIIPPAEDCWTTAGNIVTYGFTPPNDTLAGWTWNSENPALIDPGADGNPADTTYTDILLTGNGVDWSIGNNVGVSGNLGPGRYDFAENLGLQMTIDADAAGCPSDLTGSSDPNDPSYGVPDGDADADDFFYYLDQFVGGNLAESDLTGSSDPNDPSYGVPDGDADADDFFYYLDLFVTPCP